MALETGDFRLDGGAMMGSVPKVLWEITNPADELNRINLSLRCMLLDNGEQRVLIESGMGDKLDGSFLKRFHIKQTSHPLKGALDLFGYNIDDITHVILTHLHFDHAGGATTIDSQGNITPTFPNAMYYVSTSNWEAGLYPSPRDSASYLDINYKCLEDSKQLRLLNEDESILKDISTIMVHGHTNGQQLIRLDSGNETLVFCSDLIPLRSHIQLPWIMGYDLNAVLTLEEKTHFLDQAAKNNWWLWLYHDPNTVAIKIKKGKKYYDVIKEKLR